MRFKEVVRSASMVAVLAGASPAWPSGGIARCRRTVGNIGLRRVQRTGHRHPGVQHHEVRAELDR